MWTLIDLVSVYGYKFRKGMAMQARKRKRLIAKTGSCVRSQGARNTKEVIRTSYLILDHGPLRAWSLLNKVQLQV